MWLSGGISMNLKKVLEELGITHYVDEKKDNKIVERLVEFQLKELQKQGIAEEIINLDEGTRMKGVTEKGYEILKS